MFVMPTSPQSSEYRRHAPPPPTGAASGEALKELLRKKDVRNLSRRDLGLYHVVGKPLRLPKIENPTDAQVIARVHMNNA
ncbi:hypothetical protein T492DRAFT_1015044 [Pavlovales sp. CCMP2436]|nr:hypothetical protein T492DRAFT_1015044 [Pavlovales sp. CCMP2436]